MEKMETIMSEEIRYAWGESSLGDFIAAVSDRGLVAFEFGDRNGALVQALRDRFPEATVEEDPAALSDVAGKLAALVENPAGDPGLPSISAAPTTSGAPGICSAISRQERPPTMVLSRPGSTPAMRAT
jgi:hypothetical protein